MKRILGIAMVLGLVGALTVMAQEVKPGGIEVINLGGNVKLEMVLIRAGNFVMGSPKEEKGGAGETQHEVTLTKPFYMGKYEVTQEQWKAVMGKENNPSNTKGEKLPVTNVSWVDCQGFIRNLNARPKGGYRLPTESEWEYACRAGTTTAYSFGGAILPQNANISESKKGTPVKVGSYKPNAFGLFDMHGNVREWCEDFSGAYPAGAVTDPKGPEAGDYRILRGGSFYSKTGNAYARSAFRNVGKQSDQVNGNGFRLAKDK